MFELTEDRRNGFLKLLSAQNGSSDTVRIGCTLSEKSCVAAGRFLLLFSEAGWQIEENKVFRMEPQIPIVGVAITTRAPADDEGPLPPHLADGVRWTRAIKPFYWAFRSLDIPVALRPITLERCTLGIYFGSNRNREPDVRALVGIASWELLGFGCLTGNHLFPSPSEVTL